MDPESHSEYIFRVLFLFCIVVNKKNRIEIVIKVQTGRQNVYERDNDIVSLNFNHALLLTCVFLFVL